MSKEAPQDGNELASRRLTAVDIRKSSNYFDPNEYYDPSKSNIHGSFHTHDPELRMWRKIGQLLGIPIGDA